MPRKERRSGESRQLPSTHVDRGYGQRAKGAAFDEDRRGRFLQLLVDGASKLAACRLTPVACSTVDRWVDDGDRQTTPEAAEFASFYWAALEFGNHEIDKKLAAVTDPFVLLQIKAKRDARYGDLDLKRERQRFEIDAAREKHELEMGAKREDLEAKRLRNVVLAVAAEKARGGDKEGALAFGLAQLLDPEFGLSESAMREIATQAIARGWIATEQAA